MAKPQWQRVPLITQAAFEEAHQHNDHRLRDYQHRGRRGSVQLDRAELDQLDPAAAVFLHAGNTTARINWARIVYRHVATMVGALDQSAPVAFVTLIEERFTITEAASASFDPRTLQRWTRALLPHTNFVGMVEAALYTNVGLIRAGMKRAVSWHVHLIVWDASEARLGALCAGINSRHATLLPGVCAAHYRMLEPGEVEGQAWYMNKAPISDHRVWPRRREATDSDTGEITVETTGRFTQRKRELRPCDLARMSRVMGDHHLDRLAFAAGDGRALLKAIIDEARLPLLRLQRR